MKPNKRFLDCVRGRPVDRVPLDLEGTKYSTRDQLAAETDSLRRAVAERIFDDTHYRFTVPAHVNRYLVTPRQRIRSVAKEEVDGSTVHTSELDTPRGVLTTRTGQKPQSRTSWQIKYPVECLEDIEKIRSVPWELPEGLAPPDMSRLPDGFDTRGILATGVSSPFVCVAGMMSYQYFLELCATEPVLVRELTQICLDRILAVLDVVLAERTIEYVWMGGCEWITPPMGSPAIYEELAHDFEEQVIKRVHEAGALVHVHCHGNVRSTIDLVVGRGADYFEPVEPPPDGDITFAEAKERVAGRMTLGGNIEARLLEKGSVDEVEAAVRAAFEGGRKRMVLSNSAGPISAFTERMSRNYNKLVDVWEELSPVASPEVAVPAARG